MAPSILQDIAFSIIEILLLIDTALQIHALIFELRFGQYRAIAVLSQLISFYIKLGIGFWLIFGWRCGLAG